METVLLEKLLSSPKLKLYFEISVVAVFDEAENLKSLKNILK